MPVFVLCAKSTVRNGRNKMIKSLNRINDLSKKSREEGLTPEERVEQQVLREDYLREIRGQVTHTFSSLKVIDPFGNDVTPKKVRKLKIKGWKL